ncbi:MAG: hypothetical protein ACO3JL_18270, partial [Myxococcota bacterium]
MASALRAAWLLPLLSLGLYGCTAGLSCSGQGAGACINAYPYPQSTLSNGVAFVDDGLRLRMTQAGLDFLQANLKTILIGAFGPDPSDPDLVRIEVDDIVDLGSGITLGGIENGERYPTALLLPVNALADQLRFEFVQGARDGLRARVQNLVVGLDARVFGAYDVGGLFTATAACDVDGTADNLCPSDAPGCQALTKVSFDVYIYPDVGQGTQCIVSTGECFRIDVDVRDVALGSISNSSLEISVPPTCQSGSPSCSQECSDGADRDLECTVACVAVDFVADIVAGISGALLGILEPFLATVVEQAVREALSEFDGAPLSISDTLDLAELSEDLINESAHPLGYAIAPTGNAFDVNCVAGTSCAEATGMDLLLKSGAEASPPDANDDDAVS